jgi:hypothetical protein
VVKVWLPAVSVTVTGSCSLGGIPVTLSRVLLCAAPTLEITLPSTLRTYPVIVPLEKNSSSSAYVPAVGALKFHVYQSALPQAQVLPEKFA